MVCAVAQTPEARRRSSSVALPRVGVPRLLRLQADARLREMLRPPVDPGIAADLAVPSRERVDVGEAVRVEVSFGPMSDEIVLRGQVGEIVERGARAPLVHIRIVREHEARVRYIHEVVAQGRAATARAYRRVDSQARATWYWGLGAHATQIHDISKGGAFVRSAAPPAVGSRVRLELDDSMVGAGAREPLALDARVAWTGRSQGQRGFGVRFRISDRSVAERVAALVRWHEQRAGLID